MMQTTTPESRTRRSISRTRADEIVVVERLNKVFRDFWMRSRAKAVEDVSFEIYKGEVFGLLGPNGSGKSTTIKILLGLLHKTTGRVVVFNKLPSDVAVKRRIGYLPEESYLYPFLNARETLEYYAKLFEIDRSVREKRIDELLDMVGLSGVQFRQVREYSKGMQRRIGIAQALINDPELLILDEPTTGLDPIGTRQIKDLILELARRGKTILLSSHLLADVEDCVDRMVILYGGKVQAAGTCDELLESRDKSIIETDQLDDDTISRIDAMIRERTGGVNAINRVSRPRQRLEELFIDIVERARAANIATAGAQHGGVTASFLRAEEATGDELIAELTKVENQASTPRASEARTEVAAPKGPDASVLDALMKAGGAESAKGSGLTGAKSGAAVGTTASGEQAVSAPSPATRAQQVDRGVLDALLDKSQARTGEKPGDSKRTERTS